MSEVKIFTILGETVIAKIIETKENSWKVKDAMSILVVPNGPPTVKGQSVGLKFKHWQMFAKPNQSIVILKNLLFCEPLDPSEEILTNYSNFTSPILTPPKGEIPGLKIAK